MQTAVNREHLFRSCRTDRKIKIESAMEFKLIICRNWSKQLNGQELVVKRTLYTVAEESGASEHSLKNMLPMLRRLWCEQEENRNCLQTFHTGAASMVHRYTTMAVHVAHQPSKIKEYVRILVLRTAPSANSTTTLWIVS